MNLEVHKLHSNREHSLLLVELKQGHRHQIRFQLSELGYPIIGDQLYGNQQADRMYLHCLSYLVDDCGKRWFTCHPDQLFYKFFDIDCALEVVANKLRSLEIS